MMLVESGDDIVAVDCGLLFPDDEMPGSGLRHPRLHLSPRAPGALPRGGADPRARGPRRRALLSPARVRRARVRHAADPGHRAAPAARSTGVLERADLRSYAPGDEITIGRLPDRPHPRHALHRRRHRAGHRDAGGHGRPHGRLQARPASGGRTSSPTTRGSPRWASAACSASARTPPTWAVRGARARRPRWATRCAGASTRPPGASSWPPSPRTSTASSRCWTSPRRARARSALLGRSMVANVAVAAELGYLHVPEGVLLPLEELAELPARPAGHPVHGQPGRAELRAVAHGGGRAQVLRGGRGRPRDLLLARDSRQRAGDRPRSSMRSCGAGAEVLWEDVAFVHVSGHASQDDLKHMLALTRPRYFMPVHGEYRHLLQHARLADGGGRAGGPDLPGGGRGRPRADQVGRARAGPLSGGARVRGRQGHRRRGRGGAARPADSWPRRAWWWWRSPSTRPPGSVVAGPEIASRGFVYMKESEELMDEVKEAVREALAAREDPEVLDRELFGAGCAARCAASSTSASSASPS